MSVLLVLWDVVMQVVCSLKRLNSHQLKRYRTISWVMITCVGTKTIWNWKVLFYAERLIHGRSNKMKRLKNFKITERIPRSAIKVLPMQFGDDEATRHIFLHHAKRVIRQHTEEIQKLADQWVRVYYSVLACLNFKVCHNLLACIKITLIALSKSHFRIWTKLKILSITKYVHMDKMNNELK